MDQMEKNDNFFGPACPEWWQGTLDLAVLSDLFGFQISKAEMLPYDHIGGHVAELTRLLLTTSQGQCSYVIKQLPASSLQRSLTLNLFREAAFLNWFRNCKQATILSSSVVACPFATYSFKTGQKLLVMEDLSDCVEGRRLMLQSHPLGTGNAIPADQVLDYVTLCFKEIAQIHAAFWNTSEFKEQPWCRKTMLNGDCRKYWHKEQEMVQFFWNKFQSSYEKRNCMIRIDDKVLELLQASINKISWLEAQKNLQENAFTLSHGDFWPANISFKKKKRQAIMYDWELVGVGSGCEDLAQFMCNMDVSFRRAHERSLLELYVTEMNALGVPIVFDQTYQRYIRCGAAKMCWLLPLMLGSNGKLSQFFHDISQAWFEDFGFSTETVPQPRL